MQRRAAAKRGDTRWTRLRESLRTGLWFVPTLFVAAATVLSVITVIIDQHLSSTKAWFFFDGGPTSAEQILATIAASMITVTGLVFTITIVVLQLASNQFSPRVLRTFLRDRGSQIPLGVFTATFVYSLFVLIRVRTGVVGEVFVPRLSVSVSFALIVASMLALVYFVNHVAQSIRVVNIIESVAEKTRRAIDATFPLGTLDSDPEVDPPVLGTRPSRRSTGSRTSSVASPGGPSRPASSTLRPTSDVRRPTKVNRDRTAGC